MQNQEISGEIPTRYALKNQLRQRHLFSCVTSIKLEMLSPAVTD